MANVKRRIQAIVTRKQGLSSTREDIEGRGTLATLRGASCSCGRWRQETRRTPRDLLLASLDLRESSVTGSEHVPLNPIRDGPAVMLTCQLSGAAEVLPSDLELARRGQSKGHP